MLGRYWPYITPEYLLWEMTIEEVNEYIDFWYRFEAHSQEQAKRMRAWMVKGGADLGRLEKDRVAKVIRG